MISDRPGSALIRCIVRLASISRKPRMTDPRSLLSSILTAVCVGGLLSACGPRIPATITIGVAQPLSGPSAARGQDIVNGAKLAAADLNAAGFKVAGKVVQIERSEEHTSEL